MPLKGSVHLTSNTTTNRPAASIPGRLFYNSSFGVLQIDNGSSWLSVGAKDGSSYSNAADSAAAIKSLTGTTSSGTYWININNVPTQIYCNMNVSGGGWMSFASAPTDGWFGGNTGADAQWLGLSYSYGTYSSTGAIGNYWRNYSQQSVTDLLLMTGNGTYWIHMKLSDIYHSPNGNSHQITLVASSNNFSASQYSPNTIATVMHRTAQPEDPWINAGNSHANGGDASGTDYMFWGENNLSNSSHGSFRAANGGVILFVK